MFCPVDIGEYVEFATELKLVSVHKSVSVSAHKSLAVTGNFVCGMESPKCISIQIINMKLCFSIIIIVPHLPKSKDLSISRLSGLITFLADVAPESTKGKVDGCDDAVF